MVRLVSFSANVARFSLMKGSIIYMNNSIITPVYVNLVFFLQILASWVVLTTSTPFQRFKLRRQPSKYNDLYMNHFNDLFLGVTESKHSPPADL